jgi:hypothetical protein
MIRVVLMAALCAACPPSAAFLIAPPCLRTAVPQTYTMKVKFHDATLNRSAVIKLSLSTDAARTTQDHAGRPSVCARDRVRLPPPLAASRLGRPGGTPCPFPRQTTSLGRRGGGLRYTRNPKPSSLNHKT